MIFFNIYILINCVNFCVIFFLQRFFCGVEKLFRKGGIAGYVFWKEFEKFYKVVINNIRDDKWEKFEEKDFYKKI